MKSEEVDKQASAPVSQETEEVSLDFPTPIRQDPVIEKLLKKLPPSLAGSYSDEQLQGMRVALGDRTWGTHFIDSRGTFAFPFVPWRFYYVFLLGKNRRAYTRREKHASMLMFIGLVLSFILISVLLGILTLYILKSALGIDLLEGTSLGVWDWVRELFD
ncbi:hypothetical protein [Shewanella sp. UCD-KL12]|uniref:hypothetical protein n=1 Tax=Shewanella sp. UCD-KL12 TaxID=1917163 RepID=UPI000970392F|nr:hypothetical protein [Shewanella sp. UCD-KL12]